MTKNYVDTPKSISFNTIAKNNYTFSSSQYKDLIMENSNFLYVKDFLSRPLKRSDLGEEVGSINYIQESHYYFIRTKALQEHTYLPEITPETALPIMPKVFKSANLKQGDVIISKDSNIGEIAILDRDYPNYMLSGAIYKLPLKERKFYLLSFIKHSIFRQQLDYLVPKGATIRHAKTQFLDCKIPLPNKNAEATIAYVEVLMQAIINKEKLVKNRHELILKTIEDELLNNQNEKDFVYEYPRIKEVVEIGRLDTNLYTKNFRQKIFTVKNYKNGYKSITSLGFTLCRGQNLQISNIGKSVYSAKKHEGFYTLMLPKFLSKYGTVNKIEFLGNSKKLKNLKIGDIIFGAEGFEKGRSIVILNDQERTITNIHGITIQQETNDVVKGIFVKCFLDYLRSKGLIDLFAVGGNGGSLAQRYWEYIPFPNFPSTKQEEIVQLYHYPENHYETKNCSLDSFLTLDSTYNKTAGIYELDKTAKLLKARLNEVIDQIVNDEEVKISFDF